MRDIGLIVGSGNGLFVWRVFTRPRSIAPFRERVQSAKNSHRPRRKHLPHQGATIEMKIASTSPNGQFRVLVDEWEARNSMWVSSPSIWDLKKNRRLHRFKDECWSLDGCDWPTGTKVCLTIRKYPGKHQPAQLHVEIDCTKSEANVLAALGIPLADLEAYIDATLSQNPLP